MKAFTVRQPWADAIAYGGKYTENRAWPLPVKEHDTTVLIHAVKAVGVPLNVLNPVRVNLLS